MTYPTQADLTARLKWLVGAKAMAIVLALLMPTQVLAQSRTFYGADGRVSGRSITGSNGSTTFYDASGRVTGRSTTSGNLMTIYGSETDAVSAQPDKRADDMRQDNDPPDARTAEEREIIAMLERTKGRKLTEQEINRAHWANCDEVRRRADPRAREHRCNRLSGCGRRSRMRTVEMLAVRSAMVATPRSMADVGDWPIAPPADQFATEELCDDSTGALSGQVPGRNHVGDGDRLALVLGDSQGLGPLARVNPSGEVFQCGIRLNAGYWPSTTREGWGQRRAAASPSPAVAHPPQRSNSR